MFYATFLHLNDTQVEKNKAFCLLRWDLCTCHQPQAEEPANCSGRSRGPEGFQPGSGCFSWLELALHHRTTHIHRAWICNLGLKVKSNPLRQKSTHLAYSQRTMPLVRPVSGSSPPFSLLDLIYCNRRRRMSLLRWANFTTRPVPPVILTH